MPVPFFGAANQTQLTGRKKQPPRHLLDAAAAVISNLSSIATVAVAARKTRISRARHWLLMIRVNAPG
jgi:hypothetical protein